MELSSHFAAGAALPALNSRPQTRSEPARPEPAGKAEQELQQQNGNERGHEKTTQKPQQNEKAEAQRQALLDQQTIKELAARDREVRAHEGAHMAVGGRWAGSASYTYERGPNGVNYAVGGEVPISTSPAATPELTIAKAQTVRRAALAPAEPSPADYAVAAEAARLESQALQQLAEQRTEEARETQEGNNPDEEPDQPETPGRETQDAQDQTALPSYVERQQEKLQQTYLLFSNPERAGFSVTA